MRLPLSFMTPGVRGGATVSRPTRQSGTPIALLILLLGGAPGIGGATDSASATRNPPFERPGIFDRVEEFRLENGMLWLLLPRHDAPTAYGRIRFRVGNVDNQIGQTGLAHMFEHMAFKGTDRIGTRDSAKELALQDSVRLVGAALSQEVAKHQRADTARVSRLEAELERLTERQISFTIPNEFAKVYDQYSFDYNAYTSVDFTEYSLIRQSFSRCEREKA